MFIVCIPPLRGYKEERGEEKNERQKKMVLYRGDIEVGA